MNVLLAMLEWLFCFKFIVIDCLKYLEDYVCFFKLYGEGQPKKATNFNEIINIVKLNILQKSYHTKYMGLFIFNI